MSEPKYRYEQLKPGDLEPGFYVDEPEYYWGPGPTKAIVKLRFMTTDKLVAGVWFIGKDTFEVLPVNDLYRRIEVKERKPACSGYFTPKVRSV